jgi:hypothetical protein
VAVAVATENSKSTSFFHIGFQRLNFKIRKHMRRKQTMRTLTTGLALLVAAMLPNAALAGDWLEEMSKDAQRNLQIQKQQGGFYSNPGLPPPGPGWPPQGNQGSQGSQGSQTPGWSTGPGGGGTGLGGRPPIESWYVFCNTTGTNQQQPDIGNIEIGKSQPFNPKYKIMGRPHSSEPVARAWVNQNCPSWRCNWNGACVRPGISEPQERNPCRPGQSFVDLPFGQGYCK